jgi:hypothetical protein
MGATDADVGGGQHHAHHRLAQVELDQVPQLGIVGPRSALATTAPNHPSSAVGEHTIAGNGTLSWENKGRALVRRVPTSVGVD